MAMIKCEDCGREYSDKAMQCPQCGCPNPQAKKDVVPQQEILQFAPQKGVWSAGRLIIGILSLCMSFIILLQSCSVGLLNSLSNSKEIDGFAGAFLAFMWFVGGIVAIVTRNSRSRTVTMLPVAFYWLGALLSTTAGIYRDLKIWGFVSFVFGVIFLLAGLKTKKKA